ncbi:MAG: 30S ribosomal protein S4 [Treponema sp.]|jgi:small subunit ribosomal protein S4|nr:30S ribosomal protein S4 [Treponema sp.]
MGKSTQPLLKRCKALGINPLVMGYSKESKRNQKEVRRGKKSEYGIQLQEKQKLRFIYGVLEKQFKKYYVMASKKSGVTGEVLLQLLESRLDNVLFRMNFAKTRNEAKQLINHGHICVNGKKVDIPSYLVKVGDVISVKEGSRSLSGIKVILTRNPEKTIPSWLEVDSDNFTGKVTAVAARSDIDYQVKEQLVVEYYSK